MSKQPNKLSRSDQAILFLYLIQNGLPAWGGSQRELQEKVFAKLLNISEGESREAFIAAMANGLVDCGDGCEKQA